MNQELSLYDIEKRIYSSNPPKEMETRLISIDGCGGAGKSTFADRLSKHLRSCPIVHTDDFASWDNPFDWYGRMIEQVLCPLQKNQPARFQRYDWDKRELTNWIEIDPQEVIIIEGVSSSRREFRDFLSFSIYIETERIVRFQRGLERDGEAARNQWLKWMEEEDCYILRDRPEQFADLILSGEAKADKIVSITDL